MSGSGLKGEITPILGGRELDSRVQISGLERLNPSDIELLHLIYQTSLNRVNRATDADMDRALVGAGHR
jgi:hypothetical protein